MRVDDANQPDQLLNRAIDALRQNSVPPGPFDETIALTISAARRAASQPQPTLATRVYDMLSKNKTMTITSALAATVALAFMLLVPGGKSLALGQVVEKLRSAQPISFQVEVRSADPARPATKVNVLLEGRDKSRVEFDIPRGKVVSISNGDRAMMLYEKDKTAMVAELPPGKRIGPLESLEQLQAIQEKDAHSLGEKMIDGVRSKGFEATVNDRKFTVWANAENGNPIRIECTLPDVPPPHGPVVHVLTNFNFDAKVDPNLFSVEVPEGYQVSKPNDTPISPVEDMIAVLRFYAERTGGEFPSGFDVEARHIAEKLDIPENQETLTADQKQFLKRLDQFKVFLKSAQVGRDYQYYPGAKLGDKDRLVFWCVDTTRAHSFTPLVPNPRAGRPIKPANDKYLAVYGDLRVEKLNKDQLPAPAQQ